MHSTDGLRWYLALGHGAATGAWWGWLTLCILVGAASLVWWWRRGRRQQEGRLRDVVPPLGLMLLGCLMLFLPAWPGLDVWLNDVDDALLWAFLQDAPAAAEQAPQMTTASICRGVSHGDMAETDGKEGACHSH